MPQFNDNASSSVHTNDGILKFCKVLCKTVFFHYFPYFISISPRSSIVFDIWGSHGKLHNEKLHKVYSSTNIIRMIKSRIMKWAGHVTRMGTKMIAHRILVRKQEETTRRHRRRSEDNIKMDLREVGWDGKDCIDLAEDRNRWRDVVNTVMNLRVP
jgi:hypothetical protein